MTKEDHFEFNPDLDDLMSIISKRQQELVEQALEARMNADLPEIIVPDHIAEYIKSLPLADRPKAIESAKESKNHFLQRIWTEERSKLAAEFIIDNALAPDLNGWEKYLQVCFAQEDDVYKVRGFDDWAKRYLSQMISDFGQEAYIIEHGMEPYLKGSFFEHYFGVRAVNPELWLSPPKSLNENTLLVHSINESSLTKAIKSQVLGRSGRGAVAFCQDRIAYDRGYVIIFQANELLTAGYPLQYISEDPRDARILQEWRSAIPVDLNLARLIVPTSDIPDRWNAARASIATSYFGEDYLRDVPRLK